MPRQAPLTVALAACFAGMSAVAQPAPPQDRMRLIQEAQRADARGDHDRALDRAMQAWRMRETEPLRMLIAQQHGALGHSVLAVQWAGRCLAAVQATPQMPNQAQLLAGCTAVVTANRPRVGLLTIRVPADAPADLRVRVGEEAIPRALWGLPLPVAPGPVRVEATGTTGAFHRTLTLTASGTEEVPITLTPSAPPPRRTEPPPVVAPVVADAGVSAPPVAVSTREHTDGGVVADARGSGQPPPPIDRRNGVPWVGPGLVMGAGALSFGAAAVFYYVLRADALNDQAAHCPDAQRVCYRTAVDDHDRAQAWTTLTNVALGVGMTAVVSGALWLVLGLRQSHARAPVAWNLGVVPSAGGAILQLQGGL